MFEPNKTGKEKIVDDARRLAEDVGQFLKDNTEGAQERIKGAAEEKMRMAREQVDRVGRQWQQQAKENPWATFGLTALAGLVAGALLSQSFRRRW